MDRGGTKNIIILMKIYFLRRVRERSREREIVREKERGEERENKECQ